MKKRTITGILLAILLIFALVMRGWVFSLLWVGALCIALHELLYAFSLAGHRPVGLPNWVALLVGIPVFTFMQSKSSLYLLAVFVFCAFVAICIQVMFRSDPKIDDLLVSLLPMNMFLFPGLCMLSLLRIQEVALSKMLMWLVFVIPTITDVGAYHIGTKYGKTKLIPQISPNKTVEGALGGLLTGMVGAIVVYLVASSQNAALPPWWHILLLGFVGAILAQVGDLFASLIKRHCKVKDFGHIFPGHGGMMDRLDSILIVVVLIFLYQVKF